MCNHHFRTSSCCQVDDGFGFPIVVEIGEAYDEPIFQVAIKPLQESAHRNIVLIPGSLGRRKNQSDRCDDREKAQAAHVLTLSTERLEE